AVREPCVPPFPSLLRPLGRLNDIGEKNCCQGALAAHRRLHVREKLGDVVGRLINIVAENWQWIGSRQFQKPSIRNAFRQVPPALDIHHCVLSTLDLRRRYILVECSTHWSGTYVNTAG